MTAWSRSTKPASAVSARIRTASCSIERRRNCAWRARGTSIRLTIVLLCGNTSTSPASSSRINASRIGVYKDLRYDPQKDFDLLSVVVRTPNVLVANPGFPANNIRELIEQLNKNPGKVTFASSGTGSSDHLTAALFWQKTGTSGIHVPYRGGGPAINDLIAGHANVSFQNLGAIAEQVKAGRLKALAVTSDKRVPILPEVPTMAEAGVKDLEVYSWQAAAAPKGLPAAIKAKLEAEFAASATSPDVKAKFEAVGFDVVANNGEQFAKFLADEIARWKSVIATGKVTAD